MVFCLYSVRYRSVGWVVSSSMKTKHLPLTSTGTKYLLSASSWWHAWAYSSLRTHRVQLDHRVRYMSDGYQSKLDQCAMIVSTGSINHSYDNALAQSVNGAYKTELIRERTLMSVKDLEHAIMCWATWWNTNRLHTSLGYKNPATIKPEHYTLHKTKNKLTTKNANKKPAHIKAKTQQHFQRTKPRKITIEWITYGLFLIFRFTS